MYRINKEKIIMFISFILIVIIFYNTPGVGDVEIWKEWMDYANENGLKVGYAMQNDMYPPFALFIQIIIRKYFVHLSNFTILRIVNLAFLLISVSIIYVLYKDIKVTVLSFSGLILSTNLGYLDIEMVPFIVLSIFFFSKGKLLYSSFFFTILCLIKFQPLIILPYFMAYFISIWDWEQKRVKILIKWRDIIRILMPPLIIGGCTLLFYRKAFIEALYRAIFKSGSSISPNGLNFGWILQYILQIKNPYKYGPLDQGKISIIWNAQQEDLRFRYIFIIILFITLLTIVTSKNKSYKNILKCAIAGYTGYFLYNSGVHENHLFLGMVLMILLYLEEATKKNYYRMILYIISFNINLLSLYGLSGYGMGFDRAIGNKVDPTLFVAIYNVVILTYIIIEFVYEVLKDNKSNLLDEHDIQ